MHGLVKLNEADVVSKDGYKISYGRDTLKYLENSRRILVPIEHLGDPYEIAIYLDLAIELKGHQKIIINQDELDIIEKRIRSCLTFLGRNFSIRR